ncbi:MAG: type II secretion system F family protein [Candidatus Aenigmatarchaeota archaeon]
MMPSSYRKRMEEWFRYAGRKGTPNKFFNMSLLLSVAVGALLAVVVKQYALVIGPAGFIGMFALTHGTIALSMERRSSSAERVLPDALQLMAANSRAGYIPSHAFLMSARDEFGPLADAIKNAGKELVTGRTIEDALNSVTHHIKSDTIKHTMQMIGEGIRSGGHFSALLEETANDIRRTQILQKEMRANVMMYVVFIFFAACLGGPILFSLSAFLISTIGGLGSGIDVPTSAIKTPFMKFGTVSVPMEFLQIFSVVSISMTTIFSGLIIAMISTGRPKTGIKYIPIFFTVAMLLYLISGVAIEGMFGKLIPTI